MLVEEVPSFGQCGDDCSASWVLQKNNMVRLGFLTSELLCPILCISNYMSELSAVAGPPITGRTSTKCPIFGALASDDDTCLEVVIWFRHFA